MANSLRRWVFLIPLAGGLVFGSQATGGKWVAYTAHYTETLSSQGPGANQSNKVPEVDESRAEDGSLSSIQKVDGKPTKGKLWLADGEIIELNYSEQQAVTTNHAPRRHLQLPKTPPSGSAVIAGLPCSVYPVKMSSGTGRLCVDVNDDILLKEEFHITGGGRRTDYVKQVSSIDLNTPVDSSQMRVPDNFRKLVTAPASTK